MPARNSPLLREILARAAAACDDGVRRAHILNRDDPDSLLLELFSRDGVGTLISAAPFDQTRRARAEDAAAIFALTASEAGAALAPVDRARLESEIDNYRVVTRDGAILACAFARVYPAEKAVELGGLTVRADYRHQGKGDMLFRMIEAEARAAGMRDLFLLTTQAEHWFVERGFRGGDGFDFARRFSRRAAQLLRPRTAVENPRQSARISALLRPFAADSIARSNPAFGEFGGMQKAG